MSLQEAYIMPQGKGEIASGIIRLVYSMGDEERVYEIPYDTKPGRGGDLRTVVDREAGDFVRYTCQGRSVQDTLTPQMKGYADETLQHYRTEAIQGEGAVKEGSVTFSGVVGTNDGWLPTDS